MHLIDLTVFPVACLAWTPVAAGLLWLRDQTR